LRSISQKHILQKRSPRTEVNGSSSLGDVSIVIPSFNGVSVLRECLETLEREAPDCEIIVADGGSTDGSRELVRELVQRFPRLTLLEISNHGWAHATNRGFERAMGDYLLTINTDTFVTRAALVAMRARLEAQPGLGAVSPVVLNPNLSRQWFFGALFPANWIQIRGPMRVNLVFGCCAMLSRSTLETIGGFDENFFFYNEEFDWCWRAAGAGYQFELVPETVVHLAGGSTGSDPKFQLESVRGTLYLIQKHFPAWLSGLTGAGVELLAWLIMDLSPRADGRRAWRSIHDLAKRGAILESPFPLSGRGEVRLPPRASQFVED
jgi:N-acetylglucosaminyl-diphospho-decaprenol L-rhamnosyltransferase